MVFGAELCRNPGGETRHGRDACADGVYADAGDFMRRSIGSADPAGAGELPPHHRRGCVVLERGDGCGGCPAEAHRQKRERYARLDECSTGHAGHAERRAEVERPLRGRLKKRPRSLSESLHRSRFGW